MLIIIILLDQNSSPVCMCDKQPLMNIVSISNSISVSAWGTENPYINFVLLYLYM